MIENKIHIVSTRKIEADLKQMASEKNIIISDFDFLNYEFIQSQEIIQVLSNNTAPLIFTSQHAVKAILQLLTKNNLQLKSKSCYTIEGVTENLALKNGFTILGSAKDSNQLANKIIEQKRDRLIFCCGNIRLNNLKDILIKNKIELLELEVYKKTLTPHKLHNNFDGVMFFSPSQIDSFLKNNILSTDTPAFCIGNTTSEYLKSKQHFNCYTSKMQSVKSVLDFAIEHFAINK